MGDDLDPDEGVDPLVAALDRFRPATAEEARDLDRVRDRVADGSPWDRTSSLHLTASALIVDPAGSQVLLRWHERQQGWIQVGGHGDPGERDPLAIALRESTEETGLADLVPWPSGDLQHLVIVQVPGNEREPPHEHADLRFFLATEQPSSARPEREQAPVQWLSVDDAMALTGEDNVRETIQRAAANFDR